MILDYGHNPAAMEAMASLVSKLEVAGKRILVLAAPGDRRNEDIEAMCEIAARVFDRVIVKQDDDTRGRASMEVPELMKKALEKAGMKSSAIEIIAEEEKAIDHTLRAAERGDLVLILADKISRAWKQITKFKGDSPAPTGARRASDRPPENSKPVDASITLVGLQVVKDERGVRLARNTASED